jgi:hypothetical protein
MMVRPFCRGHQPSRVLSDLATLDRGDDSVYELDALTPAQLANLLEEAILDVIDVEAYESELAEEERDLEVIALLKKQILK